MKVLETGACYAALRKFQLQTVEKNARVVRLGIDQVQRAPGFACGMLK